LDSVVAGAADGAHVSFDITTPLPADGNIIVTFPGSFTFNAGGTTNITTDTTTLDGTFAVSISGQSVTVARQGDGSIATGSVSFDLSYIQNPPISGPTNVYQIMTTTNDTVSIDQILTVPQTPLTSADLVNPAVTPDSIIAGTVATVRVSFDTANPIPADGKVIVTFPATFTLDSGGTTNISTNCSTFDGTFSVGTSGQTVTVSRQGDGTVAFGNISFDFTYIKNPTVSGDAGVYDIMTTTADTVSIDQACAPGTIFDPGLLTETSVTQDSPVVSVVTNNTVIFATSNDIPADGLLVISFPSGFALDSGGTTKISHVTTDTTSFDGSFVLSTNNQVLTITRQNDGSTFSAGGKISFVLSNIKNPTSVGETGTFSIQTQNTSFNVIDENTAVPAVVIVSGPLGDSSMGFGSTVAGATTHVDVTFTTSATFPVDGYIKIVFPSGFDLSGVSTLTVFSPDGSIDGSFTVSVNGQTVTITRNGDGSITSAGTLKLRIANIVNPSSTGFTGTFSIVTYQSDDTPIEGDASVAQVNITPPVLEGGDIVPGTLLIGTSTTMKLKFTSSQSIPASGKILLTFPSGFDLSSVASSASDSSGNNYDVSRSGQILTITKSDGSALPAASYEITLSDITTPSSNGSGGDYTLETQTSGGSTLEKTTISADTFVLGLITLSDYAPSKQNAATIQFRTAMTIQGNGSLELTFPSGFDVSGNLVASSSEFDEATFSISVTDQTVTVTRGGGSNVTGLISLTISNIVNPSSSGSSGTFSLTLNDDAIPSNQESDSNIPAVTISNPTSLNFLGEGLYQNDATDIDSFTGSQDVLFKVRFTDSTNQAPNVAQVWIDFDGDGYYDLPEKFNLSASGSDYVNGEIFSALLPVVYDGSTTVNYKFYFLDADSSSPNGNATSSPAGSLTVSRPQGAIPILQDPSIGTFSKGVDSSITGGNSSSTAGETFTFRTVYFDPNVNAQPPTEALLYLDRNGDGQFTNNEIHTMTQVDPSNNDYLNGVHFSFSIPIYIVGSSATRNYYFKFNNGSAQATGTPTSLRATGNIQGDTDTDGNGLSDSEEGSADTDNDGTADYLDVDTATIKLPSGDKVILDIPNGNSLSQVENIGDNDADLSPIGMPTTSSSTGETLNWEMGFFKFTATTTSGASITVKLHLPASVISSGVEIHKYNATTGSWINLSYTIVDATTISYTLTDGSTSDGDGSVNGVIVDPIGIAVLSGGSGSSLAPKSASSLCLLAQEKENNLFFLILSLAVLSVAVFLCVKKYRFQA
jgi:hypothetical protein